MPRKPPRRQAPGRWRRDMPHPEGVAHNHAQRSLRPVLVTLAKLSTVQVSAPSGGSRHPLSRSCPRTHSFARPCALSPTSTNLLRPLPRPASADLRGGCPIDRVLRCARPSHTHALNPVARASMHTHAEKDRRTPNSRDAMRSYTRGWGVGAAIKEIAAAISHTHVHTRDTRRRLGARAATRGRSRPTHFT